MIQGGGRGGRPFSPFLPLASKWLLIDTGYIPYTGHPRKVALVWVSSEAQQGPPDKL